MIVGGVDVGSGTEQAGGGGEVVPVSRPQERGGAVGARGVDVDVLVEQRAHLLGILRGDGAHEPQIRTGGGRQTGRGQHHEHP